MGTITDIITSETTEYYNQLFWIISEFEGLNKGHGLRGIFDSSGGSIH